MDAQALRLAVVSALRKYNMIRPQEHVLLAFSGGPDSTALLALLMECAEELSFTLSAAHFNHGIRGGAADSDALFCKEFAAEYQIDYYEDKADVPAYARQNGLSIEQAGRILRYDFLEKTAAHIGATKIATAHHMDDQAETVLFNIGRGTGLRGAAGMLPVRGRYIRPLLFTRRSELEKYLAQGQIPSCEDETNGDDAYARNALRRAMPGLEKIIPGFVQNTARFALLCAEDEQALSKMATALYAEGHSGGGLRMEVLLRAERAVATRAIRLLAAEKGLARDFEKAHVDAVLSLQETGKALSLPHGYTARLSYGVLHIEKEGERAAAQDFEIPLNMEGTTRTPAGDFLVERVQRPDVLTTPAGNAVYAPTSLANITIRPRRAGDRIVKFGGVRKKLKAVYMEGKVDRHKRQLPVLTSGEDVLWVPGVAVGEALRVPPGDGEVLRITYLPGEE